MPPKLDAEHILILMGTARFEELYKEVCAFYRGDDNHETQEELLKKIKKVFNLPS